MNARYPIALAAALTAASACATPPASEPAPAPAPVTTTTAASTTPTFDRSQQPKLGAPPAVQLPPVVTKTLSNGMRLLIVEHRELPVADFIMVVNSGSEADPPSHAGLATMTASMLDEGTTTRNSLQIADQSAYLGLQLGTGAGWDASRLFLHTPTRQLDSALALFADVVLNPSFPQKELDRLKQDRLTSLLQVRDRGPAIADRAFSNIVYGADHPYGRSTIGTEATTKQITRADVQRFYRTYYRPNNASVIVVGNVNPDDIARRFEALFGKWEKAEVPGIAWKQPQAAGTTQIYLIDKPAAPQSSFRIGTVGVPRNTDDFFALLVANTILGGSFTSRLNNNLRETKGYTYGAGSVFDMRQSAGPFVARAEITGTKSDSALVEFMKELNSIRDTVPAAELAKAKRLRQLELPAGFESTTDIANRLVPIVLYNLPLAYYNSYVQNIEAVTQADVQRVARRYIDPSKLSIVVVGDRASVEPTLKALNMAPVQVRDITGEPLRP